ncbi:TolB family protein [Kitasatospora sp. NPDC056184]|uniref:TolB family protein n=1 Tax=Kitasatospora sp. NPDC056184 TaxID=3345738 RepID=UPI0035D85CBB
MTRTSRTTRNRWLAGGGVLAAAVVLAATAVPAQAQAGPVARGTVRISTGVDGATPDDQSFSKGLSADGRYALFTSWATNVVEQPGKGWRDAYVRDLRTGRTERVNLSDADEPLAGFTDYVAINANGRYVAFDSDAEGVVPGPRVQGRDEVYVRDRWTGRTELISGSAAGTDTDQYHASYAPSISADGRYVAFLSSRTDLDPTVVDTPAADTDPSLNRPYTWKYNVYLTDRRTHTTRLISRDANGKPGESLSVHPTISADGRTIGFSSLSALLPEEEPPAQAVAPADVELTPSAAEAARRSTPQGPGEAIASHPTSAVYYVYDVPTGKLTAVSAGLDGTVGNSSFDATISPDGRRAIYTLAEPGGSTSGHRYHTVLHVRDLRTGKVTKVSGGLPGTSSVGSSDHGSITADNRWLYFESAADNLVAGPQRPGWDVYRQDLRTGRTERVSTAPDGSFGNGDSREPFVAASGRAVAFASTSGNLVAGTDAPAAEGSQAFVSFLGRHRGGGDDQGENQDD